MVLIEIKNFEVLPGRSIVRAIKDALTIAKRDRCIVRFGFNSVDMEVWHFHTDEELGVIYHEKLNKLKEAE